ncbi:MAG: Acylphosphatase [Chlamydiia bacterium]|nr:Acylphosphatase [Chlamydiia bacterium]
MHYHVVVKGRVQGVCFRATVCERAKGFDLSGTVKNLADGDVEIHVFGDEKTIDAFLESLKQDAGFGMVSSFSIKKDSLKKEESGFKVVH